MTKHTERDKNGNFDAISFRWKGFSSHVVGESRAMDSSALLSGPDLVTD